jgi:hypothetical protein
LHRLKVASWLGNVSSDKITSLAMYDTFSQIYLLMLCCPRFNFSQTKILLDFVLCFPWNVYYLGRFIAFPGKHFHVWQHFVNILNPEDFKHKKNKNLIHNFGRKSVIYRITIFEEKNIFSIGKCIKILLCFMYYLFLTTTTFF